MATKRVSQVNIDWTKLAERVPDAQKAKFLAFRAKSDGYLRRMLANPELPPKIDWTFYKKSVPVAGMVDNFQKQYEALKIPYPPDTLTSQIDAQEKEVTQLIEAFKKSSNERIAEYKSQIAHIKSLLPYEQMTLEDFYDAHPELALDALKKPTFWPHNPEEQLGYVEPQASSSSH